MASAHRLLVGVLIQIISMTQSAEKEGWFVSTLAGGIVVGNQEGVGRDAAFSFMQRSDWFVGIALTRDGRSAIVADQYNNRCVRFIFLGQVKVFLDTNKSDKNDLAAAGSEKLIFKQEKLAH